jgi:hypothetical protein
MRVLLLALMIALLPLRGWLGDAMALELAQPPAASVQHTAAPCAEHAVTVSTDEGAAGTSHHAGCGLCQICHQATAAQADLALPALPPLPQAAPATGAARFTSAESVALLRPPRG